MPIGTGANRHIGKLPRDSLLTAVEVGEWLKIARRQVQRLGIPWIDLGRKTARYQVKDVLGVARDSPAQWWTPTIT
jgi:hypothetical protein